MDQQDHTVTGLGFAWGSNRNLGPGASITYRFSRAGVYPYTCIIHPGMVGAVVVGDPAKPTTTTETAAPVAVSMAPPRTPAPQPVRAGAKSAASTPTTWRTVALVSLALLLALVGVQAARSRRRIEPSAASRP